MSAEDELSTAYLLGFQKANDAYAAEIAALRARVEAAETEREELRKSNLYVGERYNELMARVEAAERRLLPENVAKALFAIDPGNKGAAFEQMPKQYREAHIAEAGGFLSILSRIEKEGE
jgi:hypothetical protein